MFIKMEMFSGRIVTDKTLNSKQEADSENETLKKTGSLFRWIKELKDMGKFEKEHRECKQ